MQKFDEKISLNSDSPQERRGFLKKLAGLAVASTAMGGFTNLFAKKNSGELTAAFSPDDYIASIAMFGGNFAPRNWAFCDGQLLPIASNEALFSLIGCTFGGDCRTNFALPDLRGRVPIHEGTGPGLTTRILGQRSGQESVTLTTLVMPSHNHVAELTAPAYTGEVTPNAFSGRGGTATNDPINNFPAAAASGTNIYNTNSTGVMGKSDVAISLDSAAPGSVNILNTGGSQPHENMQPFLCVNFIICLDGIYPPRN